MFELFSTRMRDALTSARGESQRRRHAAMDTAHLLFGVLEHADDFWNKSFAVAGFDRDALAAALEGRLAERPGAPEGAEPESEQFSPGAQKALESALGWMATLGSKTIEPEHLFLGLLDVKDGVLPALLAEVGIPRDQVRALTCRHLGAKPGEEPKAPAPRRDLFDHFATNVRQVMRSARDRARERGDSWIGTAHLLWAAGHAGGEKLRSLLSEVGIDEAALNEEFDRLHPEKATAEVPEQLPLSPNFKRCLELSLMFASEAGDTEVDTRHLLRAMADLSQGEAVEMMARMGDCKDALARRLDAEE